MSVNFRNLRMNNQAPQLSVEEAFRLAGAWSGIEEYQFDNQIFLGSLEIDGTTGGQWSFQFLEGVALPSNFVLTYHKVDLRQGIILRNDLAGLFHLIYTDASGYPGISLGFNFDRVKVPDATPTEADVTIVFRQDYFDDDQTQCWRTISVYMNDALVLSNAEPWITAADNIQVGFVAFGTDHITYTDITVPELCEIAEFLTLDPGDYPTSGLQSTLDGRYVKWFIRYNGALRAWRKRQRTNVMTLDTGDAELKRSFNYGSLANHIRMSGAYVFGNAKDDELIRKYGDRFIEVNNQMLLTQPECDREAANELKRAEENSFSLSLQTRHVPILEPEDRITVDGNDWVINDYSWELAAGAILQTYNLRRYVWGD